ncbi:MAG: hypothetical protein NVSMB45_17010 [Ginsengibacter sp.]
MLLHLSNSILRAPLSNILGLVKILKNLQVGEIHESVVNMVEESANKLDDIIKKTALKNKP